MSKNKARDLAVGAFGDQLRLLKMACKDVLGLAPMIADRRNEILGSEGDISQKIAADMEANKESFFNYIGLG